MPAQLLSPLPFLNYVGIHLFIGALLVVIPAPAAWLLDTLFPLLDGATRAHAVIAGVEMVRNHPDGAGVRSSLFVQLLIGAISASGGGQLAGTLGTWDPSGWSLHTPPILLARNALDSLDVWAPALAAFVYGLSTFSHPSYAPLLAVLDGGKPGAILSPLGARAAATLVIAAAFGYKAVVVHWAPGSLIVGEKAKKGPRPIEARTRAQKTRKGQ